MVKTTKQTKHILFLFVLACLITAGFLIRIHELDYTSLSHDEIGMMQHTEGLFIRGTPSKMIDPFIKPMTTYELLPYSVAIPVILFGFNDYAARLHSVFWGTLEILLIYILGKTLFNRKTGLVAAAIYTFHPWCINWSQNIFYPQLSQVMTTLTVLFFYKAIDSTPMNKKYLYMTGISFSLMYLSWEGSGFLLVTMVLAILVHKGSNLSWLKNKHLWTGFTIIFLTVLIQQSRRILYQEPYLRVGARISDIGLLKMFFLDPMYNPYFYIDKFFFMENNWILTISLIAGICFLFKNRPLMYLYIMLLSTVFVITNFLSFASNRYVYNLEPILILIASAVIFIYIDAFNGLFNRKSAVIKLSISFTAVILSLMLIAASNSFFLKLYLLSKNPFSPPTLVRQNVYWNDYRSTNHYVKENMRKGDIVFSFMPHALKYYTGFKGDYNLTTLMSKRLFFDISGGYPGFLDKYVGNPTIISLNEFRRIVEKHNRIWFISAPNKALTKANDNETVDYITRNFKSVYESYNTKVYLREK